MKLRSNNAIFRSNFTEMSSDYEIDDDDELSDVFVQEIEKQPIKPSKKVQLYGMLMFKV